MDNTIRIPLDLPDVQIQAVSQSEQGDWLIRVESKIHGTPQSLLSFLHRVLIDTSHPISISPALR